MDMRTLNGVTLLPYPSPRHDDIIYVPGDLILEKPDWMYPCRVSTILDHDNFFVCVLPAEGAEANPVQFPVTLRDCWMRK